MIHNTYFKLCLRVYIKSWMLADIFKEGLESGSLIADCVACLKPVYFILDEYKAL